MVLTQEPEAGWICNVERARSGEKTGGSLVTNKDGIKTLRAYFQSPYTSWCTKRSEGVFRNQAGSFHDHLVFVNYYYVLVLHYMIQEIDRYIKPKPSYRVLNRLMGKIRTTYIASHTKTLKEGSASVI